MINSTIGILGILDIAKNEYNIKAHDEDFGQTLGYWGVPAGPHIVIPFFGPSNLRDLPSMILDSSIGYNINTTYINYTIETNHLTENLRIANSTYSIDTSSLTQNILGTIEYVNINSLNLGIYENLKKDSLDFYTFSRDFYEEKRKIEIKE
jgi:phospholipid-binding lipoprotein MlaA